MNWFESYEMQWMVSSNEQQQEQLHEKQVEWKARHEEYKPF